MNPGDAIGSNVFRRVALKIRLAISGPARETTSGRNQIAI
jgi:hypothetical protein